MPPSVTPHPRSWVTAITAAFRRLLSPPPLPDRALWVLDLATRANCSVYEDEHYHSWAVDEQGHVHDVEREVNQIRAYGGKGTGLLAPGHWVACGKVTVRRWQVTAHGELVLVAAGRRRPLAIGSVTR